MSVGNREHGSKPGSGGVASSSQSNADRRERLRQLALETIDLAKDPYFMKNLHPWVFRVHQTNLARRAARENRDTANPQPVIQQTVKKVKPKKTVKIGRPGYKVVKERDPETNQLALLFSVEYPEIEDGIKPRYRFMSSFEQKVEQPDKNYQYLLFAAEPYETIAFKVPNKEIEKNVGPQVPGESKFWTKWDEDNKTFSLQLHFKPPNNQPPPQKKGPPGTEGGDSIVGSTSSSYDPMQPKQTNANPHADYAYFNKSDRS